MNCKIPVYIINLERRTDRKINVISEFSGKNEFELTIVPAIVHEIGSFGLWQTICRIIRHASEANREYVLICEDDHIFTESYTIFMLNDAINRSKKNAADILLGGVSWFGQALQVDNNLFWVDRFTGTQFMVIYRKFYQKILEAGFLKGDIADLKISSLTESIFVMYPFVSVQKEFGYSDATKKNGEAGRVTALFDNWHNKLEQLDTIRKFYELNKE